LRTRDYEYEEVFAGARRPLVTVVIYVAIDRVLFKTAKTKKSQAVQMEL
jgi:hypothetical protein